MMATAKQTDEDDRRLVRVFLCQDCPVTDVVDFGDGVKHAYSPNGDIVYIDVSDAVAVALAE